MKRAALVGCIALAACAAVAEEDTVGAQSQDLFSGWALDRWQERNVHVCFETSGFEEAKAIIRGVLLGQRSWVASADINFVGFAACVGDEDGIHITLDNSIWPGSGHPVRSDRVVDTYLPPDGYFVDEDGVIGYFGVCTNSGLDLDDCLRHLTLHEVGHALGFDHEQDRPDNDEALCTPGNAWGAYPYGGPNEHSIMSYCPQGPWLSGLDRSGAAWFYGPRVGFDTHLHDYNADGQEDLLCHGRTGGGTKVLLADASGHYDASPSWTRSMPWCAGDSDHLLVGNYTGGGRDGTDDLLCFDTTTGSKRLDSADSASFFTGPNWSRADSFCLGEDKELFFYEFSGDGRDDLACYDRGAGGVWIDYAASGQRFGTIDVYPKLNPAQPFCNSRLYVGDFDGDRLGDFYCHDRQSGRKRIDYARDGHGYADWEAFNAWCNAEGQDLLVGDFNGDEHDDLLCRNVVTGQIWIDYASAAGTFDGPDYTRTSTWCTFSEGRVFVGKIDADNRDDLLCHDMVTGRVWIDYASNSGALAGTDWTSAIGFCTEASDELH